MLRRWRPPRAVSRLAAGLTAVLALAACRGHDASPPRAPAGEAGSSSAAAEPGLRLVLDDVTVLNYGKPFYRGRIDLTATVARIEAGERHRHRNDGAVFLNRERRLPAKPRGYYREYVHPTDGLKGPAHRQSPDRRTPQPRVAIRGGTYDESLAIDWPVTLDAADGDVSLGDPSRDALAAVLQRGTPGRAPTAGSRPSGSRSGRAP